MFAGIPFHTFYVCLKSPRLFWDISTNTFCKYDDELNTRDHIRVYSANLSHAKYTPNAHFKRDNFP